MKTLLILSTMIFSSLSMASDGYLYILLDSYSDEGGETTFKAFKIKNSLAKADEGTIYCKSTYSYDGNEDSIYITTLKENDYYYAMSTAVDPGDQEADSVTASTTFSRGVENLFIRFEKDDGYVGNSMALGSRAKMEEVFAFMEEDVSVIENAVDISLGEYQKVYNEGLQTEYTLSVSCDSEE